MDVALSRKATRVYHYKNALLIQRDELWIEKNVFR